MESGLHRAQLIEVVQKRCADNKLKRHTRGDLRGNPVNHRSPKLRRRPNFHPRGRDTSIRKAAVRFFKFPGLMAIPLDFISGHPASERITAILVHGTYEGASNWVNEVPGKVTFASELRRELGSSRTHVEPFLWRSSNEHSSRLRAADDLAKIIDNPSYAGSRVIVIAFSHGGSVALQAAGKCRRTIDQLVCLATPHCHVLTVDHNNELLPLPVYCSPESVSNVAQIVNVWCRTDTVVRAASPFGRPWAELDTGLTQQDAIEATYMWRRKFNYPRLLDDGDAVREIISEAIDVPINTCLFAVPALAKTNYNFEIASELEGKNAHSTTHCARMGSMLGRVLRWKEGVTPESLNYLSTFVVPRHADNGEAVKTSQYAGVTIERFNKQTGWTLTDLTIVPPATNNGQPWDSLSSPDLFANFKLDDGRQVKN